MNSDGQQVGGLSPAAQKVYPEIVEAGEKMRIKREQAKGESVVSAGNKIVNNGKQQEDVIDFDIALTASKSELTQDPSLSPEKKTIRRRFLDKVRTNVVEN